MQTRTIPPLPPRPQRTVFFLLPQGVQCGDAGSGPVTAGGLSCSATAIQRCSWSALGIEISIRPVWPPPTPLNAFSQAPTPPARITWDARVAVRAKSCSRSAPGTRPDPAPAPAPASKARFGCHCVASSRRRTFLRRAPGRLLPRRPRFSRWHLGAVAVTRVGSALPESPFRPVSHGKEPMPQRSLFLGARQPRSPPSAPVRAPASRPAVTCARPLGPWSPCACVLCLPTSGLPNPVPPRWGLSMPSILCVAGLCRGSPRAFSQTSRTECH